MRSAVDPDFWRGKRVLLTGHTGFKGSWTAIWLDFLGARVFGLGQPPDTDPNLFTLGGINRIVPNGIFDIEHLGEVESAVEAAQPEIVIHMAAQSLVLRSIREPLATFRTNVLGTANLLQALRKAKHLTTVLVVTTDKVYENDERGRPFSEMDPLGGHDPYSASKAAAEIVTQSFGRTYLRDKGVAVATARGGNVVGGGDFSPDRVIPDTWRAFKQGKPIKLRNPSAVRPWQYVLDCVSGYLCFAQALAGGAVKVDALNFGPDSTNQLSVAQIVTIMQDALNVAKRWVEDTDMKPREMQTLTLDSHLARKVLGWEEKFPGEMGLRATAAWYRAFDQNRDMRELSGRAIEEYMRQ